MIRTRTVMTLSIALASLAFSAGCSKEETKAEPPAPVQPSQPNTTTVQAAPGTQVQAGGTQVKGPNGATVQVQGAGTPVVMQNGANVVKVQGTGAGKVTEMTAEDGRKVVVQGDKMVAVDPSRPGAKVEVNGNTTTTANGVKIEGNKVTVPGVGVVTTTP